MTTRPGVGNQQEGVPGNHNGWLVGGSPTHSFLSASKYMSPFCGFEHQLLADGIWIHD